MINLLEVSSPLWLVVATFVLPVPSGEFFPNPIKSAKRAPAQKAEVGP